jgi:peptidyl-prolyl cis-trans isomerase A (cyclophilin A)
VKMFALTLVVFGVTMAQNLASGQTPASQPAASATSKPAESQPASRPSNEVVIETNMGNIVIQLTPERTPVTVDNFLRYADEKFYDGLLFHRVIKGFMIQGGGFTKDLKQKETHNPIRNEAQQAMSNSRGTLAMARTQAPNSATSQFFINLVDNKRLDYPAMGGGYAVFAKVVEGMDVVDKIADVAVARTGVSEAQPLQPVEIISIHRK